jgi:hypothetical protein
MPAKAVASAAPPMANLSASRADRANGNEDSHSNNNDRPYHRRMPQDCVWAVLTGQHQICSDAFTGNHDRFFEEAGLQIATK